MGRERIDEINRRLSAVQAERQSKALRDAEEWQRHRRELEAERDKNIKAIEATGVPDFFRELIREGILVESNYPVYGNRRVSVGILGLRTETRYVEVNDFTPATLSFRGCDSHPQVSILFNGHSEDGGHGKSISFWLNNGDQFIDGEKLEEDQDLFSALMDKVVFWADKTRRKHK